jgi:DNA repair protein RadC
VIAALSQVKIAVHDHIVVGKSRHTSFKNERLI